MSDQVGNPGDRFSRVAAHIRTVLHIHTEYGVKVVYIGDEEILKMTSFNKWFININASVRKLAYA